MTDKVQKILNEIATRKLCTMDEHMAFYNDKAKEDYRFLSEIEELIKALQQEPVSEDLEEEASRYAKEEYSHKSPATLPNRCIGCYAPLMYAFKAGANWQKEQFEKERLKHCDALTAEQAQIESDFVVNHLKKNNRIPTFIDAIEYGMRLQEEQTMKKAIDGEVGYWNLHGLSVNVELPHSIEEGDKVKVIVIKEN